MNADPHARVDNYWDRSKRPRKVSPALAGDIAVDVAIIGAGYTGLATAYHLKVRRPLARTLPSSRPKRSGFGASGRNAGFVMTLFGASVGMMKSLHGGARVREAHDYMVRSIDGLAAMIAEHRLDCDFERSGFLKVATSPRYEKRIRDEIALFEQLGVEGYKWLDAGRACRSRALADLSRRMPGAGMRHHQPAQVGRRARRSRARKRRAALRKDPRRRRATRCTASSG